MSLPDLLDPAVLSRLLSPLSITVASAPEPIGNDFGFASNRAAVTVAVEDGAEIPVVVKVWDGQAHGLGEIEFYNQWALRLSIPLPRCHATYADDDLGLIVLDDLRPMRHGDDEGVASRADAVAIARTIGAVHATTVGATGDLPEPRFGRILPPEWHDTRRVAFIERFGMPSHPLVRQIVVQSELAARVARSLLVDAPRGLTHSDLHLDNIVFVDDVPMIIDWARPGWGPGSHDLSSVLFSCSAIEDFEAVIDAHREVAGTEDDHVDGSLLQRLVIATLGVARWQPSTSRQERLIAKGQARVDETADWLAARRPSLIELLRG